MDDNESNNLIGGNNAGNFIFSKDGFVFSKGIFMALTINLPSIHPYPSVVVVSPAIDACGPSFSSHSSSSIIRSAAAYSTVGITSKTIL